MNPFQQNWIDFKTHFHTAHCELKETGELTMEDAGYHQSKMVNKIVAHMSGLPFTYPPQYPAYTPVQNPAPTIVTTVQPTPVANVATDAVYNILPQLLTSMQQMKQLLIQMQKNQTEGGGQTINRNTRTSQAAT